MKLAIIKYNAGNTQSVIYALERLGVTPILTDDHEAILSADKVILPGVGEASSAMRYLEKANLEHLIPTLKQPFLGVCVGMQLMCTHSEENDTRCLGVFPEKVRHFPHRPQWNVPHMGWNTIKNLRSKLFEGIQEQSFTYFAHSYYVEDSTHSIATTEYIHSFSAGLQKDNFYAAQFHPEKSAHIGAQMLENFVKHC